MTAPVLDDFLLRLAPAPLLPVAPELIRARESIRTSLAALRDVPDTALERDWSWQGRQLDVRYGFYRQFEELEDTRTRVSPLLAAATASQGPARPLVAATSATRWDLHGLLAGLEDAELDRNPGNNEWTLRQTLAHIVSGQRGYAWFTAWWMARRDVPMDDFPERVPDDAVVGLPEEDTEGLGTVGEIQRRLDEIVDLSASVFGPLGADDLAARARWSGVPVDVRFRVVRWTSHMREHTIQVEKTLGFLGQPVTEVDRLLRLIAGAYGRLEEDLFLLSPSEGQVAEALSLAESASARVAAAGRSVAEAVRQ
jgi:DinB family protein